MPDKTKVAILGGGMAALTSAFELTNRPGWQDLYEITVYQTGWRLGGKGASGRNPERQDRIEEHGLHILLGFYENAFKVLRAAYAELGRQPGEPLATWQEAFQPHDLIVLTEQRPSGWINWPMQFPRNDSVPGEGGVLPTPWDYIKMTLGWMKETFRAWWKQPDCKPVQPADLGAIRETIDQLHLAEPHLLSQWKSRLREFIALTEDTAACAEATFLELAEALARQSTTGETARSQGDHRRVGPLLRHFLDWLAAELQARIDSDDEARRLFIVLDLAGTVVLGMIADGMIATNLDWFAHDQEDFRDWLKRHGARVTTAESSAVRSLYDLAFSWTAGLGAGTIIHGTFRMLLTYKGAVFFEMQAGMGDTVFTPLYEVLRRRGVRFEFFHRVDRLSPSADGSRVEHIEMAVQVKTKNGAPYRPLYEVKGLSCWPSHPLYDQLEDGDALQASAQDLEDFWGTWPDQGTLMLTAGTDFDVCILGISLAAHPNVCSELLARDAKWQAMTDRVQTTQTQALQLWFQPDLAGLGWPLGKPVVGAYVEPIDTWSDMTHLIPRETWPAANTPGNLSYLCGVLDDAEPIPPAADHAYPARQLQRAQAASLDFLQHDVRPLWPRIATDSGVIDWSALTVTDGSQGQARLNAQYIRATTSPSERYVLSVPGSAPYRLREHETAFPNLYLCGDYIRTGISAGCLEAATMAGMQVARTISGFPLEIVGDWVIRGDAAPALRQGSLPLFIERGGDMVFAQPYLQQGTRTYGFLLPAGYNALRATCDKYLNAPMRGSGIEYRPIAPVAALVFAEIQQIRSLDPADRGKGWIPEKDVAFWVPVMRGHVAANSEFQAEELCWFLPYIWVDNGTAMATGREVYGFPKELAEMVYPASPGEAARLAVTASVIETFGPDSPVTAEPIVEVTRRDAACLGELEQIFHSGADAGAAFFEAAFASHPSLELLRSLWTNAATGTVPLVFLKQFRDAANPAYACHQSIVEALACVTGFKGGGWLPGEWTAQIHEYASHPIRTELGFASPSIASQAHFWLDFDFAMEGGRPVWSRP